MGKDKTSYFKATRSISKKQEFIFFQTSILALTISKPFHLGISYIQSFLNFYGFDTLVRIEVSFSKLSNGRRRTNRRTDRRIS